MFLWKDDAQAQLPEPRTLGDERVIDTKGEARVTGRKLNKTRQPR